MASYRRCVSQGCSKKVPDGARKYCSRGCANRENQRKLRVRLKAKEKGGSFVPTESRGSTYDLLVDSGLGTRVVSGEMTRLEAAEQLGLSAQSVGTAIRAMKSDVLAFDWKPEAHYDNMLGPRDPDTKEGPEFERFLDLMVAAFVAWRTEFFVLADGITPFDTEPFHSQWIRSVLKAIYLGDQLLILSPPRHGKTELLTHFCIWLILRNPNIRIIWVGGSESLAKQALKAVRQHLEDNDPLKAAYLPPGISWKPPGRSSKPWESSAFEVNTRTTILKSPTMVALGRGSTLLSRDADILICDDIEDEKSTGQEGTRAATRRWFLKDADSRNEEKTAWLYIGSRQHADDLPNYLLDDPAWDTIVESAHDRDCELDPEHTDLHVDCMLFPKIRSYRWLYAKLTTARVLGEEDLFNMVYLNDPATTKDMIFEKEFLLASRDRSRTLGLAGLPADRQLIAGLDPSASGYQAAVLWAWSESAGKLFFVAYENRKGGGINEALRTFKAWLTDYKCYEWVIEENAFQSAIRQDKQISEWSSTNGVRLHGHVTGINKRDDRYGVGAMARLWEQGKIVLPYGDSESRVATKTLIRQALRFHEDVDKMNSRRRPSDVLMASWFPMKIIRKWMQGASAARPIIKQSKAPYERFRGVA